MSGDELFCCVFAVSLTSAFFPLAAAPPSAPPRERCSRDGGLMRGESFGLQGLPQTLTALLK